MIAENKQDGEVIDEKNDSDADEKVDIELEDTSVINTEEGNNKAKQ